MADGILDVIEVGRVLVNVGSRTNCDHAVGLHHDNLSDLGLLEGLDDVGVEGGGCGVEQAVVVGGHVIFLIGGLVFLLVLVENVVEALTVFCSDLCL